MPSGKGERLVLLTAICAEYGIPSPIDADGNVLDPLAALLIFKDKKGTGDYHTQMNSDVFCKWLQDQLFPALASRNIKAILVLDNASYHCVPAAGSINPDTYTSKAAIISVFQQYKIPFKEGRANSKKPDAGGDSLDTLKAKLKAWLAVNAEREGIMVD